ncbi:hypothetical protein BRADI_2g42736v3 [Brachypodium distachyon]|uniref:Uncharacterized protein n=1 Tax=Brachypodium distachyon TaxID=15368 RepID=A0A2K2DDG4_BRADI|nr:hypothetical protein BRADI_2g42736v3 [Brachypodium distachyon]
MSRCPGDRTPQASPLSSEAPILTSLLSLPSLRLARDTLSACFSSSRRSNGRGSPMVFLLPPPRTYNLLVVFVEVR